jgi:Flp pilus assembly protein TadG
MLTPQIRRERGQAIVLLALALVGLLGFAAVALDGGNIYTEQRRAQSAADNAVLAAAYQYMMGVTSTSTISATALANALTNDYDNNSTSNWVKFYRPPISGVYAGSSDYMQVVITERVPTALAHLVYKGPFQLTVSSTARAVKAGPPVDGNAVVSLAKDGCSVIKTNGNGNLVVSNGGVFANSVGDTNCGTGAVVVNAAGGGSIVVNGDYDINVVDTSHPAGGEGTILPWPVNAGVEAISSDPLGDLEAPNCGPSQGAAPDNGSIGPGSYTHINAKNGTLTLQPGLYCITDADIHAVDIQSSGVLAGTGVMIYLQSGGMSIQQGIMNLKAPSTTYNPTCASVLPWEAPNTSVCHYLGIVFYMDRNNPNDIALAGHAGWNIEGTIYAPSAEVELEGNGDWSVTGQILSDTFAAGGNGDVQVFFNPDLIYIPQPSISLMQ